MIFYQLNFYYLKDKRDIQMSFKKIFLRLKNFFYKEKFFFMAIYLS